MNIAPSVTGQRLNGLLARRNELIAALDASRAAFRAFEKIQIDAIARADADLNLALLDLRDAEKTAEASK